VNIALSEGGLGGVGVYLFSNTTKWLKRKQREIQAMFDLSGFLSLIIKDTKRT